MRAQSLTRHTNNGFTLIEVLVALSIIAITLTAGLQTTQALTQWSERQSTQLLAQLCAENALTQMRLQTQKPALGQSESPCIQAHQTMRVLIDTQPTPNPLFSKVKVSVQATLIHSKEPVTLMQLMTVIGHI